MYEFVQPDDICTNNNEVSIYILLLGIVSRCKIIIKKT